MVQEGLCLIVESLSVNVAAGGRQVAIVSDVSFTLRSGRTLCIVGESGSGKTTCAHSILRLLSKQFSIDGKILLEGQNLLEISEKEMDEVRGAKISMIFQDPSAALHPLFSIGSQVAEMFEVHAGLEPEEAEIKAFEILAQVGLSKWRDFFEIYPHQISGGMKQRVMIAMAVAIGPQVLIADEPTTGLDLTVQKEILKLLKGWQKEHSMAMLLITHDFGVVSEMADEVAVMYSGEFVEGATTSELFSAPMHPYTQALLEARPTKEKRGQKLAVVEGAAVSAANRPDGCPFHSRCPFAMEKCRQGKVPIFKKSDTHWARCWLHEEKNDE